MGITVEEVKIEIVEQFFHELNQKVTDELLYDPTSRNINSAKKILSFMDSHRWLMLSKRLNTMSVVELENYILEEVSRHLKNEFPVEELSIWMEYVE
ncbi:TPA: hypothetical protein ACSSSU_000948 [Enterococcus faecium]|uniref:Uncharacterized protein n=1 Tax=Enterococcus faecium TaxID=1352 RepID=Q33E47_ENTFC|nr:hypothetical protein [Enterococcus faecium]MDT6287916.1 hypothetical protein [Enterococcus faecium]MDT6315529.1 hypothetical protein [Enterococcus faecium]BAE48125.1 hypothetical protein [Enterococcus faecium]